MECYKCQYRSRSTLTCDYILIEGRSRACSPENCDKFKMRTGEYINPKLIQIEKLYYSDYSDRRISRELNISRYTVYTWRQSQGLEAKGISQRGRPKGAKAWNTNTATSTLMSLCQSSSMVNRTPQAERLSAP